MVAYQLIKELSDSDKLNLFLRKGLISLSIIDCKNIYEYYLDQKNMLKLKGVNKYKMDALQNTCEHFKCQKDKVYTAIKRMES